MALPGRAGSPVLIAVLSDIHGNLEALDAVWRDMAAFDVGRVVCLGDMIGYGPNPEEVLVSVRARGALCCLGNHELGVAFRRERSWFNPTARQGLTATEKLLSPDSLAFIAGLPRFLCLEGARFVHGFPPDSATTYLYDVADEHVLDWFARGDGLTFVGHTHELLLLGREGHDVVRRRLGRESFALTRPSLINAGSVGQPRDGNNNAKYLLWDTAGDTITVRFVPYDIERTVAKIRDRGFPEYFATRLW